MDSLGIIGFGTMGAAIADGLLRSKAPVRLLAYDAAESRRSEAARRGIGVAAGVGALASQAGVLLLAVKPQDLAALLQASGSELHGKSVVSIVAGRSIATLEKGFGSTEVARLMPNIAATVGESFVGVSCHPRATEPLRQAAMLVARSVGQAREVPERLLQAVTGVTGSGIAYALAFMHAMAMGGVHAGMDYRSSLAAAAQTLRGAAALVFAPDGSSRGVHPIELVSGVTSPAGTTIEGVLRLEEGAFAAAVMKAVKASADRAAEMEGQTL